MRQEPKEDQADARILDVIKSPKYSSNNESCKLFNLRPDKIKKLAHEANRKKMFLASPHKGKSVGEGNPRPMTAKRSQARQKALSYHRELDRE